MSKLGEIVMPRILMFAMRRRTMRDEVMFLEQVKKSKPEYAKWILQQGDLLIRHATNGNLKEIDMMLTHKKR